MSAKKKEDLLSSWKEIAAYLDCSVRTAKRWELSYHLPVHRLEEKSSMRVFAYKHELDVWLEKKSRENKAKKKLKSPFLFKLKKSILFIVPLVVVLLTGIVIISSSLDKDASSSHPSDFKIDGSSLVILDNAGNELWSHDTKLRDLLDESRYREHFQKRKQEERTKIPIMPYLVFEDINNDGSKEVVFSTQTYSEFGEGRIIVFDNTGTELWDFDTGRELKYGSVIFSRDYRIWGFDVNDLNNDGKMEIVVIAAHNDDFPTQLAVLNQKGKLIGEYWNSGRISEFICYDLDGDAKKEIILAAMNNQYEKGALIVFDSYNIEGSSPQTDAFRCESLPKGTEKYYILLPRTEADRYFYGYESALRIDLLSNKRLSALAYRSRLYFEFSYNLELVNIRFSHRFDQLQEKAVFEGGIKDVTDQDEYIEQLKRDILYYSGENWVSTPTMTSYWKNQ